MKSVDLDFDHMPEENPLDVTCAVCGERIPYDWTMKIRINKDQMAEGYHVGCVPLKNEVTEDAPEAS